VANELGALIADETKRAETDFTAVRNRGQAVLTVSGGLITLVGGVLALAVGKDKTLVLNGFSAAAIVIALLGFVSATLYVLAMFGPSTVRGLDVDDLADYVEHNWDDDGWDQQAAKVLAEYLVSLRGVNEGLADLLVRAILCEVVGIVSVGAMAISLVLRYS
jgi:hypothetical protein